MNVIMAVASDRALQESLRAALPATDLLICESSVGDALRRLISIDADVLILDDGPSLGREALGRIREARPSMPVVVLVSRNDRDTLAGYALEGAKICLPKPFSCEELLATLRTLVQVPVQERGQPLARNAADVPHSTGVGQYQTALRWLGRTSSYINDSVQLGQSLVDSLVDTFDAARSAVLLDEDGVTRVVAGRGLPVSIAESARFTFASGLMRWFEENACLIDRNANRDAVAAAKELSILGVRLGAPLMCGGRVVGAILIGDKASGREYTTEERELLTVMARSASTAFENARLYQRAAREHARLNTLLANITAGVVVVEPDKTVSMINQSAERILQLRATDILGRSVQKLGSGFADVVLRTLADGKPRLRCEVRDAAINATLGLSAAPLNQSGAVVVFSKLPEEKAAAEEIAYSPFWEYLASRIAQEIKNPMVAVNTFAQLLPRKYDSEDFRKAFADVVQKEIARINNVAETLFDFARRPRLMLQRTAVNDTVQNALRSFEDELRGRSIALETHWAQDLPEAELDPVTFSQAVHHVVQNSIEAMPSGGTLKVTTRKSDNGSEVIIADTGPGIPEKDAPFVFMPFFSTKEQGMGIGLTLADRIMRQHNGEIKLLTDVQEGGAFAFRLPAAGTRHADHPGG